VIFLFVLYVWVFAIIGRVMIGQGDLKDVQDPPVQLYWGTIGDSFMTMMMCITEDGWVTDIARPHMEAAIKMNGVGAGFWYFFFFAFYVIFGAFGILNLLTAIFVEHLYAEQDGAKRRKDLLEKRLKLTQLDSLRTIFTDIDRDGNGDLSRAELMQCLPALKARHLEDQERKDAGDESEQSVFDTLNVSPEIFHELLQYFASDASGTFHAPHLV